ncbi:hypothetical protein SM124_15425 [Bacillus sp. 31A1R]|uniref:Uncharacterized protein n=1 Tax=Robertmurraya mangrovi TaxID=3098077 RepID=A0ABU5J139_9BACI|nr:hypothetical protein [Bacillus sp. 31A1R]MDZ5473109.1 hypothetical protein [Bacillus sp. 31A1R]
MILKQIDLSLMSEHLNVHKGVLNKLETFFCAVDNPTLRQVIYEQYLVMSNHVKVMLSLMNPEINEQVTTAALNYLEPLEIPCTLTKSMMTEGNIALELRNTAKTMAQTNFESALMMKASNVKDIHIHMALQQTIIQNRYSQYIKENNLDVVPKSTLKEQLDVLQSFKKMFI